MRLLAEGHNVIGLARDFSKSTISDINFTPVVLDLSEIASLAESILKILKEFQPIDAVVCCAGKGQFGGLEEFSFEQIRSLIDLNFLSHAYVTKAIIPMMKKAGRGDIVFIGSEAALSGAKKGAVYCASKFAIRGFAQALREECARSNVRVTTINPGMVRTPFFNDLMFSPGDDESNFIEADDVATAISMVLSVRDGTVFDEINLSPLKKVIQFQAKKDD